MVVKVLVVDDSGFFRRRVSEILSADSNIQVVGTATNGKEAIDQALAGIEGPVIIVAHSAGAIMVAHWAQRATRAIQGALLVAPADLETPMPAAYPTTQALQDNGWLPIPRQCLPCPSIVAASSNDPLAALERSRGFAESWGSRLVELGPVGHLNPVSGYGHWPKAKVLIEELLEMTAIKALA